MVRKNKLKSNYKSKRSKANRFGRPSIGSPSIGLPEFDPSRFDPLGSYTGNTIDNEPPTQDADDL